MNMMNERHLRRELNLPQVLMLGTAGTIAAEIFVLTGHAAGKAGPASVLVLLLVGLLSSAFALNYAELATTYPVAGGALTYVRRAYGNGLRAFLVGSMDSLSSAFYAALSAVGFAYSLRIFLPFIPIVPTALMVVLAFTILHLFGVSNVGRAQMILGGILLTLLGIYVVAGLILPHGFSWERFAPGGEVFVYDGIGANIAMMLGTMALIFNAFVGFELIADDAEEVSNPSRNIPIALLGSLAVITLIYTVVTLVTLGTVPWQELAGSEAALTQAVTRFLPGVGPVLIGIAGIIATLTSINTAMLSATREAMTLSRLGLWPKAMARLGRLRTPYVAILLIGAVVGLVSALGVVTLLGYISSSGYLFVMFWSGLAMVRLRRLEPDVERPFHAPLFPITAYVQVGTCVVVIAFTAPQALAFGGAVLLILTAIYYMRRPLAAAASGRTAAAERARDRLLVAVANPSTADSLARLAANLSEEQAGSLMEILAVAPMNGQNCAPGALERECTQTQRALLSQVAKAMADRNVPFYTEVRTADDVVGGILEEISYRDDIRLLLMGWPGRLDLAAQQEHPVARLLRECPVDMAVYLNRSIVEHPRRVLVPFGGGVHARLALRLAAQLVAPQGGEVVALRFLETLAGEIPVEEAVIEGNEMVDVVGEGLPDGDDELHDELMLAYEEIEAGLGYVPDNVSVKVVVDTDIAQGTREELMTGDYDLVVIGAALAYAMESDLFGSLPTAVAESAPTSVLLVRRYEPEPVTWMRRHVKEIVETHRKTNRDTETFVNTKLAT